ncbi:MAG: phosphopantothenoylcysteine decarboxylase [Phycisphaerales bacterium]|nr:phosphopantothenoylcysteine decarboxylase [Phycisphaerales bacterium]MCB9837582.1 hypothetical protein [Phycisphaera sp.]
MNVTNETLGGKRIVLGVCGGISAYKSAALTSKLVQAGAEVTVLMTESASRFVTPMTFQALSGKPVYTSIWEHVESSDPQHISTANNADFAVVAPCSMDCLARLATGRADDVVTLVLSAIDRSRTPVLLAPAMNELMWSQPATQRNVETLRGDGFDFVGPDSGWQACRAVGTGRMAEPEAILEAIVSRLS